MDDDRLYERVVTLLRDATSEIRPSPELDARVAAIVGESRGGARHGWMVAMAAMVAVLVGAVVTVVSTQGEEGEVRVGAPGEGQSEGEVAGSWEAFEAGPLATRADPKAVWTGTEMLVVGGLAVEQYAAFSDGAAFDPASNKWRRIASRPAPGRIMVVAWTGSELFALGQQEGIDLNDMRSAHLYNPDSDTWRAATPPPRGFDSPEGAWWTGREVLVWQLGRGMLYDPAADTWREIPAIDVAGAAAPGRGLWLEGAGVLAVQGATTPEGGGSLREALFLFDPIATRWRAAAPLPDVLPFFNTAYGAWLGTKLVFNPSPGGPTYAYDPANDTWRNLPTPAVERDRGMAYFTGVPIGGYGGVIRVGDTHHPLVVADAAGKWSYPSAPDGEVPGPDGVLLWTGREIILWGRPDLSPEDLRVGRPGMPQRNAAWKWRP